MEYAGIVATVRAPVHELEQFVEHHLMIGVSCIVLFFDDPEDTALSHFRDNTSVKSICCDREYWRDNGGERPTSIEERQVINVNNGVTYLQESGCSWLISIDSDELIYPRKNLLDILSGSNEKALRFDVLEAVPEKLEYESIFEPTLFRANPSLTRIKVAKLLGCSKSFLQGEYYRAHIASKMAIKMTPDILSYGIHYAQSNQGTVKGVHCNDIWLLHFDCIGLQNWSSKWDRRVDGSGTAIEMRENRRKQMQEYSRAKANGKEDLALLYRNLYFIPLYEKLILSILGMLKRVKF